MDKQTGDLVLIVDDNATYRRVLLRILTMSGFNTLEADNGFTAIETTKKYQPKLILLDVKMPDIDGFETCEKIKEDQKISHIPIIFMTSLTNVEHKITGLKIGGVDYITKPFQPEEVLYRVKIHLKLTNITQTLTQQNQILQKEIKARVEAENKLLKLNQNLEEKVKDRTKDLQVTLNILKEKEKELKYRAYYDDLTKLPNRYLFMTELKKLMTTNTEKDNYQKNYSLLFIDLDRFKVVNDSLGHLIGDKLLQSVAQQFKKSLPDNSLLARFGGDEFIILIKTVKNLEKVVNLADRILRELKRPFFIDNYEIFISASIGIIFNNYISQHPVEILRDADVALYHAKSNGKGIYTILNQEIRNQAMLRLELENDLRRGVENQEFQLYYQPIISLKDDSICGFEALIRWQHPTKGLIYPSLFIPLAEDTGIINSLNELVLTQACYQLEKWHNQFNYLQNIFVNINLSILNVYNSQITKKLEFFLAQKLFPKSCLKIEITESCFNNSWSNSHHIIDTLHEIDRKGINLCIDDFGTGYSSLSRLHSLPIKTLKIDKSFIDKIDDNPETHAIVKIILALAHNLGMEVVAEGVETITQKKVLQQLGCDFAQGYLFYKPLTVEKATEIISNIPTIVFN